MTLSTTPRMVHIQTQLEELKKLASEPNIFVKPSKEELAGDVIECELCERHFARDKYEIESFQYQCADCRKEEEEGSFLDDGDGTFQTYFSPYNN